MFLCLRWPGGCGVVGLLSEWFVGGWRWLCRSANGGVGEIHVCCVRVPGQLPRQPYAEGEVERFGRTVYYQLGHADVGARREGDDERVRLAG